MAFEENNLNLEEALVMLDDLVGSLQELLYKLENIDDLTAYGLLDALIHHIEGTLERYDALE